MTNVSHPISSLVRHLLWALFAASAIATIGCDGNDSATGDDQSHSNSSDSNDHSTTDTAAVTPSRPSGLVPTFRTIAAESGLDFERYDDISPQHRLLEVNGGGVAMIDFDRDNLLDLFFTNGCKLPLTDDDGRHRGQFFHNLGEMQFKRVTEFTHVVPVGFTFGCTVGDYDADGFDDLYITAFGRNSLWRNNGDGTFTDITDETGTAVPDWSSSAAFADVNGDGHLDLYVVNYVIDSDENPRLCPNSESPDGYVSCTPAVYDGEDDVLFLSDGQGSYVDATAAAGMKGLAGKGLGVVVSDLSGDGRPEIYVANDGQANFLLVWNTDPNVETMFIEEALSAGVALNESGYAQAGMGVTAGDFDGNGLFDLFLTHFHGDTNTLYANDGGFVFDDLTRRSRLGPPSRSTLGFGTSFIDVDNDGWLDLLAANGHVEDRTWMGPDEPYRMPPQLFRNERDGTFVEVSSWSGDYFEKKWVGRGLAIGDLDRDGRVDAAVSHQLAPSFALRNETKTENVSITLHLIGTESNRNGIGARVEVLDGEEVVMVRELSGGGSFQSASALEVHLGIGDRQAAKLRIHWPSGLVGVHDDVSAGHWVIIEGDPKMRSGQ